MAIEKFNEYGGSINVNTLDKDSKKEILTLRTELNLYKKCLKKINTLKRINMIMANLLNLSCMISKMISMM